MKQNWISSYWWLPVLFAGIALSSLSLFDIQSENSAAPPQPKFKAMYAQLQDTLPPKEKSDEEDNWAFQFNTGELDKAILDIQQQMEKAKAELKNKDWKKIDLEMQRAMKEIDKIDIEKIRKEAEASIKSVDWDKMQEEIKESLKGLEEVELPKLKKEINENLAKEMEELKVGMEHSKNELKIDKEKLKKELNFSMEETMKEMGKSMEHAKAGLQELKKITGEMEKDGLIKKGENAKIKFKDGELYINGKKQSKETTDKYRHYFKNNTIYLNHEDGDDDWL